MFFYTQDHKSFTVAKEFHIMKHLMETAMQAYILSIQSTNDDSGYCWTFKSRKSADLAFEEIRDIVYQVVKLY